MIKLEIKSARGLRQAEELLQGLPGVLRVDLNQGKALVRIVSERPIGLDKINAVLQPHEMHAEPIPVPGGLQPETILVAGMTCRSCEIKIEKALRGVSGVIKVKADASRGCAQVRWDHGITPNTFLLERAIEGAGYTIAHGGERKIAALRPTWTQTLIMIALVLVLGLVVNRLGLLKPTIGVGSTIGIGAAFVLGLVAASSTCLAVSGGVMLGLLTRYQSKFLPVALFVGGRVLSYALLGGAIGFLGKALSPSPVATGTMTIMAALYMFVAGLQMIGRAPSWLLRIVPRLPKKIGHFALRDRVGSHPLIPASAGALTFFLPCGFTQSLQLYALTTGSVATSSLILGSFALGTAPALLALGLASSKLRGNAGKMFYRFAGALVLVLGIWNFQNGFAIAGYPLSLPSLPIGKRAVAADGVVFYDGEVQVVNIRVDNAGYTPDFFALKANAPARLVLDGPLAGSGCLGVFQIPKLGVAQRLHAGSPTVIDFTPAPGQYAFSCSMGMFRGSFTAS